MPSYQRNFEIRSFAQNASMILGIPNSHQCTAQLIQARSLIIITQLLLPVEIILKHFLQLSKTHFSVPVVNLACSPILIKRFSFMSFTYTIPRSYFGCSTHDHDLSFCNPWEYESGSCEIYLFLISFHTHVEVLDMYHYYL